jgi:hypothetical protein
MLRARSKLELEAITAFSPLKFSLLDTKGRVLYGRQSLPSTNQDDGLHLRGCKQRSMDRDFGSHALLILDG